MKIKHTLVANKEYSINKHSYTVSMITSYDRGLLMGTRIYVLEPVDPLLRTLTAVHWPDGVIDRIKPYTKPNPLF